MGTREKPALPWGGFAVHGRGQASHLAQAQVAQGILPTAGTEHESVESIWLKGLCALSGAEG